MNLAERIRREEPRAEGAKKEFHHKDTKNTKTEVLSGR
jgi:hypothetical protein